MKPEFMKRAIELSRSNLSTNDGGPFGAVVVHQGKIVGEGANSVLKLKDPTCHAEIMAIRDACQNMSTHELAQCEIYTSCEPCPMCLSAIYWARIDKIYFGNTRKNAAAIGFDDDFIYQQIPVAVQDRAVPAYACLESEAWAVFQEWKLKEDKQLY